MARPRKNPEFITKVCEGCKKEFTISSRKYRQRFCTKSCAQNTPSVQEKMKASQLKTYRENYGVDHPMKTKQVIENFKKAMMEAHGVEFALQKKENIEKAKKTKKERYGDENYNNHEQCVKTCLEKYGETNPQKSPQVRNRFIKSRYENHLEYLEEYCKKINVSMLFNLDSYKGCDYCNKYSFKCNVCGREFETDVYKPYHVFCKNCNPLDQDTLENDLYKFIASVVPTNINIIRNDRTILVGKELDIYIPFKKVALELNGLYWHSEIGTGILSPYHLNKTKSCIAHGINLIHIFETDWLEKKEIVKSVIKNILGIKGRIIAARECEIKMVSGKEKKNFLLENHLQGKDKSPIGYGLYYENELVSVMTFCKSRFDKNIEYEMYRYCNKINTSVIGGASKLFSRFVKEHSPKTVVSYNDRRYFSGEVYKKLGFNFIKNTKPNYWYISPDYKTLYNRMRFQKHFMSKLLPNFDANLTEWENMKNHGYDRIWDCGNGKWVFNSEISK